MPTDGHPTYTARQRTCFAVPAVFTILAMIAYAARVFTRMRIVKYFGPEDWTCLVALLSSVVLTGLIFAETYYGMGLHIGDINPDTASTMFKMFWCTVWIYNIALSCTKISVLIQYIRLFNITTARIVSWIVLVGTAIFGVWSIFGNIFLCKPVSLWWDKSLEGHCLNETVVWLSNSAINMATDMIIVLIPIPIVLRLCISTKQKIIISFLFFIGGFGCITSALRLKSVIKISTSQDPTYDNVPAAVWSSVEVNVAIICVCLATLKPLLAQYLPGILTSTASFTEAASMRGSKSGSVVAATTGTASSGPDPRSRTPNKVGGAVFGNFSFGEDGTPNRKPTKLRALSFSEHETGTSATASSPTASSPRKSIFGSISHSLRRGSVWSRKRSSVTPATPVIGDLEMGQQEMTQQGVAAEQWPRSHGHDAILEDSEDVEHEYSYPGCLVKTYAADQAHPSPGESGARPSTATPDTMTTLAKTSGEGSLNSLDSDDDKSEEDLYHAMLRLQTRESNARGSVSTIGTMAAPGGRRSSLVNANMTARRPSLVTIASSGEGRLGLPMADGLAAGRGGRRASAVAFNLEPQYEDEERERAERLKGPIWDAS